MDARKCSQSTANRAEPRGRSPEKSQNSRCALASAHPPFALLSKGVSDHSSGGHLPGLLVDVHFTVRKGCSRPWTPDLDFFFLWKNVKYKSESYFTSFLISLYSSISRMSVRIRISFSLMSCSRSSSSAFEKASRSLAWRELRTER